MEVQLCENQVGDDELRPLGAELPQETGGRLVVLVSLVERCEPRTLVYQHPAGDQPRFT